MFSKHLKQNNNQESNLAKNAGTRTSSNNVFSNPALTDQVGTLSGPLLSLMEPCSSAAYSSLEDSSKQTKNTMESESHTDHEDDNESFKSADDGEENCLSDYDLIQDEWDEEMYSMPSSSHCRDHADSQESVEFHLYIHKDVKEVHLEFERPIGDEDKYSLQCMHTKKSSGRYWRISLPVAQNQNRVKYKYTAYYQHKVKSEAYYCRTGLCGFKNHYDIFTEKDTGYKSVSRTFKGKLFYVKMLHNLLRIDGSNLKEILMDIQRIDLTDPCDGADARGFYQWVQKILEGKTSPCEIALMCSILGHFSQRRSPKNVLKSVLKEKRHVADSILNGLRECSKDLLTDEALKCLQRIHIYILQACSFRISNVEYVHLFGKWFDTNDIISNADHHFELPEYGDFDEITSKTIEGLLKLQDKKKRILMPFVLSKVKSVESLSKLFQQSVGNHTNAQYTDYFVQRFCNLFNEEGQNIQSFWPEYIPSLLRPKLAIPFLEAKRHQIEQRPFAIDYDSLQKLILDRDLQQGALGEIVRLLKFLSTSRDEGYNDVVCNVLKDETFLTCWKEMKKESNKEVIKNLVSSKMLSASYTCETSKEVVSKSFIALDALMKMPVLTNFEGIVEGCVLEELHVYSLGTIIDANREICDKASTEYVTTWFQSLVKQRLQNENPHREVKSRLLDCIFAPSSTSSSRDMNKNMEDILFLLLDRTEIPLNSQSQPSDDEMRSVVKSVISEKKLWTVIFDVSEKGSQISKHRKYKSVKAVLDKLRTSLCEGHISLNFIKEKEDKENFVDFLTLGRCHPTGIDCLVENLRCEWEKILTEISSQRKRIKKRFIVLDKAIRLVKETTSTLPKLKDMDEVVMEYNNRKRNLDKTELSDTRQDSYWGSLKPVLKQAKLIYKFQSSIIFHNFARHVFQNQISDSKLKSQSHTDLKKDAGQTVEEILVLLNKEVEAFKDVCIAICRQDHEVCPGILDKLLAEIEPNSLGNEFETVFKILELPPLSRDVLNMLQNYIRYDEVKLKIVVAMDCLEAVGYITHPLDPGNFLMTLQSFLKCKESGTLKTVSTFMENLSIVKVNSQLSPGLVNTLIELSNAKELIEFIITTAKDNMVDLVEAVEEYSDQLIQETTVSYLIDVHRFLRELLSNKPEDPETFLKEIAKAYDVSLDHDMSSKIKVVSCNVHGLRGLHNMLSNRGEMTKEIIRSAVRDGKYEVHIDDEGCCDVRLQYLRRDQGNTCAKYSFDDLNDLRNRALLIVNAEKKQKSATAGESSLSYQEDLRLFIQLVDLLTEIVRQYKVLKMAGMPNYEFGFWKEFKSKGDIEQEKERVNKQAEEWKTMIQCIREDHFFLNYFHTKQLWILKAFFNEQFSSAEEVPDDVLALFRYIDCNVTRHDVLAFQSQYERPSESETTKTVLCAIGYTLKDIFRSSHEQPFPTVSNPFFKNDVIVEPAELYVDILEPESQQSFHVIMSLYQNTSASLPKPSQLLFCSPTTSWEEIDLLLLRTFEAHRHGFTSRLHCIANVESLPNDIQMKFVERLKVLTSKPDALYRLAVICRGGSHHHIADQFSDHVHYHSGTPDASLRKMFQERFPDVFVVTSDLPGLGKTEAIHSHAGEKGKGIVTFPISGPFVRRNIVQRLLQLKLKRHQAIHFDVGEVDDPSALDTFLSELVITKMVSSGALLFSLATEHVYIEIANTLQQGLRNSIPICKCFERLAVEWKDYRNFLASTELASPVQIVCQYLNVYDTWKLRLEEVIFDGPTKPKPINSDRCKELLKKYFVCKDVTFSVLQSFLSVLADQLVKFSGSPFLKPKNLKFMVREHQHIREELFKALLEVSITFASRSISTYKTIQEGALKDVHTMKRLNTIKTNQEAFAEQMVDRVKGMIQWSEVHHLVIMLHIHGSITPIYADLNHVPQNIKSLFLNQDVFSKGLEDYSKMSQEELQLRLEQFSNAPRNLDAASLASSSYALTPDNILKMALIIQRMQAGIPVIIMGETGCGKTSLVRYLAETCAVVFEVFSFHAGITEKEIIDFIYKKDEEARSLQKEETSVWVFLDEINTCDYLGTINEIVCHHSLLGRPLAPNLMFVAACNPYRLRPPKCIMTAGLTGKTTFDNFSKLVYRVHPLPESMIDYVWDYGSLSRQDEMVYIDRMVNTLFNGTEKNLLVDLLATSQAFLRKEDNSTFCVSLRDVHRAVILMNWFYEVLQKRPKISSMNRPLNLQKFFLTAGMFQVTTKAIVLSLAHCYLSRLPTLALRQRYCSQMTEIFISHGKSEFKHNEDGFQHIIRAEQEDYLLRMELPAGTAKNAALRENIFVILVCILNRIPIFVVGKPGCSKSLSMQIIRSNLRGRDSKDPFLKTLPQLLVVSFQGSESSTSEGIKKVFERARRYKSKSDTLPVVLLDEIGLAENSKFNPLKVLHHLLETDKGEFPDVAVVGISNWALDPAKMNRAIHLSRTEPDVNDLIETGLSIRSAKRIDPNSIAPQIQSLAEAYYNYQLTQKHENFHGLRDYYSVVKCLDTSSRSTEVNIKKIQHAVQRNFGGVAEGNGELQSAMLEKLESSEPLSDEIQFPVTDLIQDNLNDKLARHLMIITSGDSAIGILDQTLKDLKKEKVTIFGSHFEEDMSADYSHRILSRIILYMEHNCVLILRDLERIYGSLYDMLNQNYMVVGGKKYCRVALGAFSNPMCQVNDGFRCIVLVDENKVDYSDPPFLNRFEKQLLRFSDVMNDSQKELVQELKEWTKAISSVDANGTKYDEFDMFAGFNENTLPSLVLLHSQGTMTRPNDDVISLCKNDLMSVSMPEAVIRSRKSKLCHSNEQEVEKLYDEYFEQPIHCGLKAFLEYSLKSHHETRRDGPSGMQLLVMTHSSIHTDVSKTFEGLFHVQVEKLSFFKSEKELSEKVKDFWINSNANLLVIHCRPETDELHMLLMKTIIEDKRAAFMESHQGRDNPKHVCVVVHIHRSVEVDRLSHLWQFSVLSGWSQVMIDCLEKPVIEIKELLGFSIVDVVNSGKFKKIAGDQLLWCFTRIKFPPLKHPNVDYISSLIEGITSSDDILGCLRILCCRWIDSEQVVSKLNWKLDVACDRQTLINSSTLVKAMQYFITHLVRRPLVRIIYFLQKHSAFNALMNEDNATRKECLKLLLCESVFKISDIQEAKGPESLCVDFIHPILRFPFSHLLCTRMDTLHDFFCEKYRDLCMREENLDENEELGINGRKILSKLVAKKAKKVIAEIMNSETLSQKLAFYVDDFLDMKTDDVSDVLSRDQRVTIMKAHYGDRMPVISYSDVDEITNVVAQLHCNFWLEDNTIPQVFYFVKDCMSTGYCCINDLLYQYLAWKPNIHSQRIASDSLQRPNVSSTLTQEMAIERRVKAVESYEQDKQPFEHDDNSDLPYSIQESSYDMRTCDVSEVMAPQERDLDNAGDDVCRSNFALRGCINDDEVLEIDDQPELEEFLVHEICLSFLPSKSLFRSSGEIEQWQKLVKLVLSSVIDHVYPVPSYYYLSICCEFANLNAHNSLYHLGELGRKADVSNVLGSPTIFKEVCDLIENLRADGHDERSLNEFLIRFYETCILSNPESPMSEEILRRVSTCNSEQMFPLTSSLLNQVLVNCEDAFTMENLGHVITSTIVSRFPELLEVNKSLSELQYNGRELDCHINVICSDLITRMVFKELNISKVSSSDDIALTTYHKAMDVLTESDMKCKKNAIGFICAISYLRAFMSDLAKTLNNTCSADPLDLLLRDIFKRLSSKKGVTNSRKSSVLKFLVKELCRVMCLYDVKKLIQSCEGIKHLKPLESRAEDITYKLDYDPFKLQAETADADTALNLYMNHKGSKPLEKALDDLGESWEKRREFAAVIMERFYIIRSIRTLKDTEDSVAKFIMERLTNVSPPYKNFIARITSYECFKCSELAISSQSKAIDVELAVLILHLCAVLTSSCNEEGNNQILCCIINPTALKESSMVAAPDNRSGYRQYNNRRTNSSCHSHVFSCKCGHRFASHQSVDVLCPFCKSPVKEDVMGIQESLQSAKGYIKSSFESIKCEMLSVRNLDPIEFRILHFIVHAALLAGYSLDLSADIFDDSMENGNPRDTCYMIMQMDLDVICSLLCYKKERVIILLHHVIEETSLLLTEDFGNPLPHDNKARLSWERDFAEKVRPVIQRFRGNAFMARHAHEEISSIDELISEHQLPQFDSVQERNASIPRLFRATQPNTFNKLREVYFNSPQDVKEKHQLLGLFLDYHDTLDLIGNLTVLVSWTRRVHMLFNRALTQSDAKKQCIIDAVIAKEQQHQPIEIQNTSGESTRRECEEFTRAWDNIVPLINDKVPGDDQVPYIGRRHKIGYFLVEKQEEGRFLCRILSILAEMQNEFLDKCLVIALSEPKCPALHFLFKGGSSIPSFPVVHVQDAKQKDIICYEWKERFLDFSYVATEYGQGSEITYDMEMIEKQLAGHFLRGKAYLDTKSGLREFVFSKHLFHDCANILNELCEAIPQDKLPRNVEAELDSSAMKSMDRMQILLEYLSLVLLYLERLEITPEETLVGYIDSWMSSTRPFPKYILPTTLNVIKMKHVCALYEFVEDQLAIPSVDCGNEEYRRKLDGEMVNKMGKECQNVDSLEITGIITAIRRFAFRYLRMKPDPDKYLFDFMKDPSLWPMALRVQHDFKVPKAAQKFFPAELTAGHIFEVYKFYQNFLQELQLHQGQSKARFTGIPPRRNERVRQIKKRGQKMFR